MEQPLILRHLLGQGILPEPFMENMLDRQMPLSGIANTKERFREIYDHFTWGSDEDRQFFFRFGEHAKMTCLILCTDWCPDVIWNVPVLFRVMEHADIKAGVLLMEEHLEVMDLFLTNGGRAQPIAVFMDEDGRVLGRWGARPAYIQAVMDGFKQSHPNPQASDYQENLNKTYQAIGELYCADSGNTYQKGLIGELRQLFSRFPLESNPRGPRP
nr:thioredoxin family protein [Paenibacillus timonensis]